MRSPEMQKAVDAFAKSAFGHTLTEALAGQICAICGRPATQFRDDLSAREYEVSGLCQECQGEIFGQ